jgi:hypothetical protein
MSGNEVFLLDYENYENKMKLRPHVVILGAGASVAAIPNGDANGLKTSVMNGFIDKLGMRSLLENVELITRSENLEDVYSELSERSDCANVRAALEERIHDYFNNFRIPNEVTIYDMLLLSLRAKDVIATFNWDPLLLQAYQRASRITSKLPHLLFLHGNVLVGLCEEHKRGGHLGNVCPECHKEFAPTKLLYPVRDKDYSSDIFIRDSWNAIKMYMKRAYIVTVFGYSAPKTDAAAIALLKDAWGDVQDRQFEEIEIIDIRPEEELYRSWEAFIHTHHYKVYSNFFDSVIAKFPRRTCDAMFDMLMNVKFLDGSRGLKEGMNFAEVEEYFQPILQKETDPNKAFSMD